MEDLSFNAGRLGMSSEQLMERGYQKLIRSASLYGYRVSKGLDDKVIVSGPDGIVIRTYDASDILRGHAF